LQVDPIRARRKENLYIKGPFEKPSLVYENVYEFGIIEAKSRYLIQFYIKRKSDAAKCIKS